MYEHYGLIIIIESHRIEILNENTLSASTIHYFSIYKGPTCFDIILMKLFLLVLAVAYQDRLSKIASSSLNIKLLVNKYFLKNTK